MIEERKPRILMVDDQPDNIALLSRVLMGEFTVIAARSGEKAIELANANKMPDLILLDIEMPGMDGYAVLTRLKDDLHTRNIPVIFVTAKNDAVDEIAGLELGAVDYITKPFVMPIVKARINTQLKIRHQAYLLEEFAFLDPLTEIANRRRYDQMIEIEWRRAQREKAQLSLCVIDIDHFKLYNDNYGHAAGDRCLRKMARVIADVFRRPGDIVARYGGEEFAVILPHTGKEAALKLTKSVFANIEKIAIDHAHSPTSSFVTASAGIATITPDEDSIIDSFFGAADANLYKAKTGGRRTIVSTITEAT